MAIKPRIGLIVACLMTVGIIAFAGISAAAPPPPPPPPSLPTPTPVPPPPPSGGYSPPSYSSPPAFQPYVVELRSSDGTVIGNLTGVDQFTVRLCAARGVVEDGGSCSLAIGAEMDSQPVDAILDIVMNGGGELPEGMDNVVLLTSAKVAAQSKYGWSFKPGTMILKFAVPATKIENAGPDARCYLVRYDGAGYQIVAAKVTQGDGTAIIEAPVTDIAGTFSVTISGLLAPSPAPSPSPLPTSAPTPAPCPTPAPFMAGILDTWSAMWVTMFGVFAVGEVIGAVILLMVGRFS